MSLLEKMYTSLPDSFQNLKDQMDALGKTRTFTIIEFAELSRRLNCTIMAEIDALSLPTLEQSTVENVQKCLEFLKTLTPAKLLNMQTFFMRHIVQLSQEKFCLFAIELDFSEGEEIGNVMISRLKFFEYIFYASASDLNSLQKI